MVTQAEADQLIAAEKVIYVNLVWNKDGPNFRLQARVQCVDSEEFLVLRGFVGDTNRSFALLYKNDPIRKYTVHAFHRDPETRRPVREPHKHTWDDRWKDKRVYIPKDIRIGDPNDELLDFLQECNISLRANYVLQLFPSLRRGGSTQ